MGINMVEGAFSFISGEIAKTGPDAMQMNSSCNYWESGEQQ